MRYSLQKCPEGRWELARAYPAADLANDVTDYCGYREGAGMLLQEREVAQPIIPLIINFGSKFDVAFSRQADMAQRMGSFVSGLYDGYADVAATGPSYCVQVNFTPPGAYRFFGLPLRELAGRVFSLEDVLGPEASDLTDRLYMARSWVARFRILEGFVRARFNKEHIASRDILGAWHALVHSDGAVPVAHLASQIGCSRKHLAARFATEIGQTPKAVARMLRFRRARREIATAERPGWAQLAAECGYSDQAHLIREFRALAGVTPVRYAADLAAHSGQPQPEIR